MEQRPQTSTPLKLAIAHFLQKNKDGNFQVKETFQDHNQRGTRFLGARAVSILNKWFNENKEYPYPDDATADYLARDAGRIQNYNY
jgi:hypothetical protein